MADVAAEQVLYECDFDDGDLSDWLHEGRGSISPHEGALLMETTDEPPRSAVTWLKHPFEGPLRFAYDFKPMPEGTAERACCILMACATPMRHDSLLDFERDGDYGTYAWSRTMTVYTVSYKRHHDPDEQFRRANIRILGGDTPAQWADGVGGRSDDLWHQWNVQTMLATEPDRTEYFDGHFHRIELLVIPGESGSALTFSIDGKEIVSCVDDGSDFSDPLTGGWFGFRHFVGPERCLYDNVRITRPA